LGGRDINNSGINSWGEKDISNPGIDTWEEKGITSIGSLGSSGIMPKGKGGMKVLHKVFFAGVWCRTEFSSLRFGNTISGLLFVISGLECL